MLTQCTEQNFGSDVPIFVIANLAGVVQLHRIGSLAGITTSAHLVDKREKGKTSLKELIFAALHIAFSEAMRAIPETTPVFEGYPAFAQLLVSHPESPFIVNHGFVQNLYRY